MRASRSRRFVFAAFFVLFVGIVAWLVFAKKPVSQTPRSETPTTAAAPHASSAAPVSAKPAVPPAAAAAPADDIRDFHVALDEARGFRDPMLRTREFGRIFRLWLERDAEAAMAYVRQLPKDSAEYTQGISLAIGSVAERDPDGALALARELAVTREQCAIYSMLFAHFAESDVTAAIRRLALVPAGYGRENALRALADAWGQRDFEAAFAWAKSLPIDDRASAVEAALQNLVAADPVRTLQLAQQSLHGSALERTVGSALQKLTATDPAGAAALVSQLPVGETQTFAALEVARALAAQNPSGALAWIQTLPAGQMQRLALNNVIDVWASADPTAAGRFVTEMPAGRAQDAAADQFARARAARAPQEAIAWAQSLPNASARDVALSTIASAWAQHDPAAATQWAATLSSGPTQTEALHGALSYWLLQDAPAAQNFVNTLTGDALTNAAASIAPTLAQANPVATLDWARTLATADARTAATVAAFTRWVDNAPADARAWLAQADLPAETKAKLTNL